MATRRGLTQKGKGTNVGVGSPGLHMKDRSKTTKSLELNMYFFLLSWRKKRELNNIVSLIVVDVVSASEV
jgi:hypothetical protein